MFLFFSYSKFTALSCGPNTKFPNVLDMRRAFASTLCTAHADVHVFFLYFNRKRSNEREREREREGKWEKMQIIVLFSVLLPSANTPLVRPCLLYPCASKRTPAIKLRSEALFILLNQIHATSSPINEMKGKNAPS